MPEPDSSVAFQGCWTHLFYCYNSYYMVEHNFEYSRGTIFYVILPILCLGMAILACDLTDLSTLLALGLYCTCIPKMRNCVLNHRPCFSYYYWPYLGMSQALLFLY